MSKLDFKTYLYLYMTGANIVPHLEIIEGINKIKLQVKKVNKNDVYIFKNYDEFKKFFLMYLDEISEDEMDSAIFIKGKKGYIVALKGLCEYIIVMKQIDLFYKSITEEQIEKIHKNGKLTPLEIVKVWESNDICILDSEKYRCAYFNYNCHNCLLEYASHNLEHDDINLKLVNSVEKQLSLKKCDK